ncbi:hypothetical protein [Pseudescherichia sp.]|uniref:hypothetical protein n=1 Tax=Pseudescherichia sp. TaxID=2055881 RepID=UPI00289AA92F|nr:hypothetical protein [Pseudescherichia sp.]
MNFEEHYGELTGEIELNGLVPYANSMPIHKCFLGKKFQKVLKKKKINIEHFMNVCFETQQDFTEGELLTWSLQGEGMDVYAIECKQLFVKGKHFWVYCVGIIE